MPQLMAHLTAALASIRTRWRAARQDPERGDMPDQIVWIALLVVLAITIVGVLAAKVMAKVNGINL